MKFMNEQSKRIGNHRITAIEQNKKGQMVVSFGNEKLALSPNAFTEMPLYVGKELTASQYHSLLLFLKHEPLWNYALSLASKGSYTSHDIREKLRKKTPDEDLIRQFLFTLKQQGFVDDKAFAEEYKEEKEKQLYGRERIVQDLQFKHGVRSEIVSALVFKDEAAHAQKAAEALEKRYARLPLSSQKQKGALALIRRGFDERTAREAVQGYRQNQAESGKTLKLLCEKTIKRYGAKYNGYELRSKTFAYLMSKGYSADEVERILEECL
jgi:regulatory protein